jgi:pimeloyl-ACP methyl ester carboxylesterase
MDELRRIHSALGFEKDYVLAAHSLGGLYARVFASDRPTDLSGLVLVDPAHEDMPDRVESWMPRSEWSAWMARRTLPNADGVTELAVAERARRSRLPDIPVTVITAAIRPDGGGWDARFVNEAARQLHASILRGVTSGRHIPAERSGHDVQLDQPGLVADEILRVVRASRR